MSVAASIVLRPVDHQRNPVARRCGPPDQRLSVFEWRDPTSGSTAVKRQFGSSFPAVMISCAVPPAPTTKTEAVVPAPRAAASMHADNSWHASYPATPILLRFSYSPARSGSNFAGAAADAVSIVMAFCSYYF